MPPADAIDDQRSTIVAAALVTAVVVVLGFGSGSWAGLSRTTSSGAAPAGRDLGTVVQPSPVSAGATPGGSGGGGGSSARGRLAAAAEGSTTTLAHDMGHVLATSSTSSTSVTTITSVTTTTTASCSTDVVTPFWAHLEKAHLETSPGQQVADALSLDQYVKTHTVLVEDLLSPLVGGGCG